MTSYPYKTKPFIHQHTDFLRSRDMETFALFHEQGTGKTKIVIDTVAWLCRRGLIDGLFIVADNGIHRNWINDEIPEHLPNIFDCVTTFIWQAKKAAQVKYQAAWDDFIENPGSLAIFAMNIDAIITKRGNAAAREFLAKRRCLFAVDESTSIKTPGAKRSRSCITIGKRARYRRILTGTPATESPFALYSQFAFLDRTIIGIRSYFAFKNEFGIWRMDVRASDGRQYPSLVEYRNLGGLVKLIAPYCSRVLKVDCLDLPPKLYQKRYFELGGEQQRLYTKLRKEAILELKAAKGDPLNAIVPLVITRMLRLQQIACGHLPEADGKKTFDIPGNTRIKSLETLLDELPEKTSVIIWARFIRDIDNICAMLRRRDEKLFDIGLCPIGFVRYDGRVDDDSRESAKRQFQDGSARYFVGNPRAGGKGITLTAASVVIYYSSDFSLESRIQSEDRAHRIGQKNAVTYIDIIAQDTVDEKIVKALREKKKMADLITGDEPGEWL